MKDMKAIITRAMLAFIAFILIIIVYAFVGTSEDKGKIRKDEDRIVEYIKEKVELQNKEEIRKIKFVNHEKNTSTGSWKYNVIINDKIELRFTVWREMGDIYFSTMKEGDIKLIENKNNINESNIEVIYGK
ncbi:hypothetical protein [Gemella sanguinis]|uniref:hypothetical protein n=1 Tax=Gemella sanguinis TaxID=84135 RepID=UPI0004E15F59|nr:hypothetical protein [Gemella sanguinis]NKZ25296.1 hypothetical protein [Gemella sanguinis]